MKTAAERYYQSIAALGEDDHSAASRKSRLIVDKQADLNVLAQLIVSNLPQPYMTGTPASAPYVLHRAGGLRVGKVSDPEIGALICFALNNFPDLVAAKARVSELEERLAISPSGEDLIDELTDAVNHLRNRIRSCPLHAKEPILTAPRDGTPFLAYGRADDGKSEVYGVLFAHDGRWVRQVEVVDGQTIVHVATWTPIGWVKLE